LESRPIGKEVETEPHMGSSEPPMGSVNIVANEHHSVVAGEFAADNIPGTLEQVLSPNTLNLSSIDPTNVSDPPSKETLESIRNLINQDGPGFFYLRMNEEEEQAAHAALHSSRDQLFPLPFEDKQKLANGPEQWFRYGGYRIPASGPGFRAAGADANFLRDQRESYNVGWDTCRCPDPPYGATPWPDEASAPGFRSVCETYTALLLKRSHWLRKLLAQVMTMEEGKNDELNGLHDDKLFDRSAYLLGFVRYQPVASALDLPQNQQKFGIAPHQDGGVFTLLYTDGSPGLQVCPSWGGTGIHRTSTMHDKELQWYDVPFRKGHWIVNLGTMMSRWSSGFFKATLHRVVIKDQKSEAARHSMPFFYEPNVDAEVRPVVVARSGTASPVGATRTITPGQIALDMAKQDGLALVRDGGA